MTSFENKIQKKIANFIRYRTNKKDMTFILGARCKDGIIMIGDRKMSRSNGSPTYEDKIFQDIEQVVLGASGVSGLYDKFRQRIFEIVQESPNMKPMDFVSESERLVFELNRTYIERTRGGTIELLVANGKMRSGMLQFVTSNGVGEMVRRYQVIGSGEPYSEFFLQKLWRPEMTMRQVAILGTAIIRIIEENELDEGVGIKHKTPQIWFIPDWDLGIDYDKVPDEQKTSLETRQLGGSELDEIIKEAHNLYEKINSLYDKVTI